VWYGILYLISGYPMSMLFGPRERVRQGLFLTAESHALRSNLGWAVLLERPFVTKVPWD
jgi:hypothetical protein